MKIKNALAMVTALAALPLATQAGVTPNATIPAIFGTGNPSTGWYESSAGNVDIGARIKQRYAGTIVENGNNYTPGNVQWNLEFSLDVSGTGLTLSSYSYYVTIDGGTTLDLAQHFDDNTYGSYSGSTLVKDGTGLFSDYENSSTVFQNSEYYGFSSVFGAGFDGNAGHTFDFFVKDANGNVVNTDTITVNGGTPVPEPSTYVAAALLLLPLGISSARIWRRRTTAKA